MDYLAPKLFLENERFEFLGDTLIGYIVTKYIYFQTLNKKDNQPKVLHEMKHNMISNIMLGHICLETGLNECFLRPKKESEIIEERMIKAMFTHNNKENTIEICHREH